MFAKMHTHIHAHMLTCIYTGGQKFGTLILNSFSLKTNKKIDLKTYV